MENILNNDNYICVAVSKTKPIEEINKVYNLGHRDFGENKVQELIKKQKELPKDINWHMIGHLQTNKVKRILPVSYLIHSVDSIKLLNVIDKESKKINSISNILIQLNISGETSKYGFQYEEADDRHYVHQGVGKKSDRLLGDHLKIDPDNIDELQV